ncbi:helix-turn-helix transcriptional regulator [Rhodanobacter hydrolyticus]|uniref:AlpA family transcriptional regulator n=1 Tax=Rhodanobacter hydrolyticus TaxID=2250595 RepID=A0ABW8J3K0_9GAMM
MQPKPSTTHPIPTEIKPARFLRLPEVCSTTGLSRTQIYRLAQAKQFPAPIKLSEKASAWIEGEVAQWCADRIAASRGEKAAA